MNSTAQAILTFVIIIFIPSILLLFFGDINNEEDSEDADESDDYDEP